VTGRVLLVGAGPGDPKLITLRGAEALAEADVVVYDRLVAPGLLELAPASAERVYVGKEPGRAAVPQAQIEALLVERALEGATVVRLKGGDPFVFGRGGEELLACARAGVPCEVVPGISSAVAAPALAGIPVTHRGMARSFAVVTASTAHGDEVPDLGALAGSVDTLVVLMAAGKLEEVCNPPRSSSGPARPSRWWSWERWMTFPAAPAQRPSDPQPRSWSARSPRSPSELQNAHVPGPYLLLERLTPHA
jgi:uroporphyrin-III C-methyltransferase